jgi:hypothetical protein
MGYFMKGNFTKKIQKRHNKNQRPESGNFGKMTRPEMGGEKRHERYG